jgi:hypothetical protein
LEQAEHGANLPLFWGLIASGLLVCAGLGLELSGSRAESFHAVTTTAYLVMAGGIALDASQREPPLASWLGIGALVLAAGVEWMFLGSGLSLWVWVPIKVLPAIAGIAALLFLAWTPVHERHDARGLYLARWSDCTQCFIALRMARIVIIIAEKTNVGRMTHFHPQSAFGGHGPITQGS